MVENKESSQEKSKKNIRSLIVKIVLFLAVMTIAGWMLTQHLSNQKPYSMKFSLLYQEASDGLNPNGTRYSPYLMLSDEVLSPVAEKHGEEVKDHLWIRPSDKTKGLSVSTEYTVYCKGSDACPVILKDLAESYTNYFETHYTMNDSILRYEDPDKELDYIEVADYLEKETNELNAFITKQIKKDGSWYAKNGENYQDLLAYGDNILNIDIANLRAYITENGISKNAEETKQAYEYRNLLLSNDKKKAEGQYKNRKEAIKLYDPTLFPTISVPSINTASGEYYVTTTKTGLDYIYDAASVFSDNAYKLQLSISNNGLVTRNMKKSGESETADKMIEEIKVKINSLIERTQKLDEEYKTDKRTQYLMFGEVER